MVKILPPAPPTLSRIRVKVETVAPKVRISSTDHTRLPRIRLAWPDMPRKVPPTTGLGSSPFLWDSADPHQAQSIDKGIRASANIQSQSGGLIVAVRVNQAPSQPVKCSPSLCLNHSRTVRLA
jgi:hypothetical protein